MQSQERRDFQLFVWSNIAGVAGAGHVAGVEEGEAGAHGVAGLLAVLGEHGDVVVAVPEGGVLLHPVGDAVVVALQGPGPGPLLDRLADRLGDREIVKPGVVLRLSPGHTVGHASYEICSGGTTLIAFGDTFHSPAHVEHPEWTDALDLEHVQAVGARHRLLERLSQPDTLGFGLHFADVAFGRVSMAGGHPTWCPVTTDG